MLATRLDSLFTSVSSTMTKGRSSNPKPGKNGPADDGGGSVNSPTDGGKSQVRRDRDHPSLSPWHIRCCDNAGTPLIRTSLRSERQRFRSAQDSRYHGGPASAFSPRKPAAVQAAACGLGATQHPGPLCRWIEYWGDWGTDVVNRRGSIHP